MTNTIAGGMHCGWNSDQNQIQPSATAGCNAAWPVMPSGASVSSISTMVDAGGEAMAGRDVEPAAEGRSRTDAGAPVDPGHQCVPGVMRRGDCGLGTPLAMGGATGSDPLSPFTP